LKRFATGISPQIIESIVVQKDAGPLGTVPAEGGEPYSDSRRKRMELEMKLEMKLDLKLDLRLLSLTG